ncbi:cytochrome P450 family protein [Actinomadura harenae]|uniref:Cytochrome P450 n=1 Tax=Actinomadura harenae TaxID=2483351 RepID=A0A3M2M490_9ACTN|nr:cytochrome P450 [Actinomadura harenae]RMI43633.1 cytochrome P450 [Actinomadura harenae]
MTAETPHKEFDLPRDFAQWLDPYSLLAEMRAESPVHRVRMRGKVDAWAITGYDEALAALNDARFSADLEAAPRITAGLPPERRRNVLMESLLASDPPDHSRMRGIVAKAFTARRVAELAPRVQETVDDLLDAFAADGRGDLVEGLALPLPIAVICELLGVPFARERFRNWSVGLAMPPADGATLERADAARAEMSEFFLEQIALKRAAPGGDLLSALVTAHANEDVSDDELVGLTIMLFLSGHETTLCFLANAVVALLTHPEQLAALRADPDLIPRAVDELLRYDGPVARGVARFTLEDVPIGGTVIPRGEMVIVAIGAANRDPARYPDPDVLDVFRENNPQLGFGHGIHHCLGAALARLEIVTALATLLRRFPDLALEVPVSDLPRRPGMLRGLKHVPVTFTPDRAH